MRVLNASFIDQLGLSRNDLFELEISGYDLTLAVKSSPIPEMETEVVESAYGNSSIFTAGKTKGGTFDVTFRDFLDADIVATLVAWRRKAYNVTLGGTGRARDYKVTGKIIRYKPDNTVKSVHVLEGLWLTNYTISDGDYDSGDPCEVTGSFSYDRAYLKGDASATPISI